MLGVASRSSATLSVIGIIVSSTYKLCGDLQTFPGKM